MDTMFEEGNYLFAIAPIFIGLVFIIIIGAILVNATRGINQWRKNEQSPRLSVRANVKAKRLDVRRHSHHNDNNLQTSSTTTYYYVTFEFESGDRLEFRVSGKDYGQLVEGDSGILTFQGTRFLGYERKYGTESL